MDLRNNKFNILLTTVYIFITVILMLNHELWRDEAQVWCLVRDLDILNIFQSARLEGHPLLWYIVVSPFAKLGFNVFSMQIISFIFVLASIIFFIFKAPFNNYIKTVVVLSSGMIYYLPVVARNYALIPLFLFMLAYLYENRHEKPLLYVIILILLSNTHILMLGFCLILALIFIFECLKEKNNKIILPVILLIFNFLVLFLMFNNMQNVNHAVKFYAAHSLPFYLSIANFAKLYFIFPFNLLGNINIGLFYILILVLFFYFLKVSKKIFLIFLCSFIYIFYIYYKVWFEGITYQKAFLLLLIILFCCWIYIKETNVNAKIINIILVVFFTISSISSIFVSLLEINYPFSSAKQTSEFIRNNLNEQSEFYAVGYPFVFTALSAYLPEKKFYSYANNYYITYYDFNKFSDKDIKKKPDCEYYIVQTDFSMNSDYEEVYRSNPDIISSGVYNESFRIYKKRR